jgi:hypothetical protein
MTSHKLFYRRGVPAVLLLGLTVGAPDIAQAQPPGGFGHAIPPRVGLESGPYVAPPPYIPPPSSSPTPATQVPPPVALPHPLPVAMPHFTPRTSGGMTKQVKPDPGPDAGTGPATGGIGDGGADKGGERGADKGGKGGAGGIDLTHAGTDGDTGGSFVRTNPPRVN